MHPIAGVVNHFIEVTDVDGVVRKIDVNNVVERIDVDHVVSRIDLNAVLSRIDWDDQLRRIDFDAVLRRVDTNSIIARGSTGVFTTILDTLRTQVVMIDLYLRIVSRCRFWRQRDRQRVYLPPGPGPHRQRRDCQLYPRGKSNKVVAVQGRYCGFVSKAIAMLIDIFTITLLFAVLFGLIRWCFVLFLGDTQDEARAKTKGFRNQDNFMVVAVYCAHWFLYFFLTTALIGRTLGMALVGLKVCNGKRKNPFAMISFGQAFLRTCLLPVTLTLFPPLGVIGLVRRDGRMLHDLVANTGIVYLWDAKEARIRQQALKEDQGSVISDDDDTDDFDDILEQGEGEESFHANAPYQGQEVVLNNGRGSSRRRTNGPSSSISYSSIPSEEFAPRSSEGCCSII